MVSTPLGREQLIDEVQRALQPIEAVLSLVEGGSAAFGRVDDWSDVDLVADVRDGAEEGVFEVLEAALAARSRVEARWVVPTPAWHGMSQRFYRLSNAPAWLILDIALRPLSRRLAFTEVELHGHPRVIFDKDGGAVVTHVDGAELAGRVRRRVEELRVRLPFTAILAEKELARGRLPDAFAFYWSFLVQPLVEALRLRHGPARHAFGMRYLALDLPGDVAARVTELCFVRDAADLAGKAATARAWLAEELAALAAR